VIFSPFSLRSKQDKYRLKSYEITTAYRIFCEDSENLKSFFIQCKEFEEFKGAIETAILT